MHRVADGEIAEALVWHLWQHHLPEQRPLKLTDGRQLWVHCTGDFNEDSGPDYKNACLAFGPGKRAEYRIHYSAAITLVVPGKRARRGCFARDPLT